MFVCGIQTASGVWVRKTLRNPLTARLYEVLKGPCRMRFELGNVTERPNHPQEPWVLAERPGAYTCRFDPTTTATLDANFEISGGKRF